MRILLHQIKGYGKKARDLLNNPDVYPNIRNNIIAVFKEMLYSNFKGNNPLYGPKTTVEDFKRDLTMHYEDAFTEVYNKSFK